MIRDRAWNTNIVKVWKCLIYAIGGTWEGHCERYDSNLNQWKPIATLPSPMLHQQFDGINVCEKYVYLIGCYINQTITYWRLDIEKQERDIAKMGTNLPVEAKWDICVLKVPSRLNLKYTLQCIPLPQRDELLIFNLGFVDSSLTIVKNLMHLNGGVQHFKLGGDF